MNRITRFQDIASFADRIVSYKTTAEQFGAKTGCSLMPGSQKYGYIAKKAIEELDITLYSSRGVISNPDIVFLN